MRTIISTLYVVAATFTIVPAVQADDPPAESIPANFREYFRRIDESIAKLREELPKDIASLQEKLAAEGDPKAKAELRKKVAAAEKRLAQVRQPSYQPVVAVAFNAKGSIGKLPAGRIVRIIDKETAVLETKVPYFVVTGYPTKELRAGRSESLKDTFEIVTPQTEIYRGTPDHKQLLDGFPMQFPYCVVAPVKPRDLAKYRAMYEAEKQAAAEKAAAEKKAAEKAATEKNAAP